MISQSQKIGVPKIISMELVEPVPLVRRATKLPMALMIIDPEPSWQEGDKPEPLSLGWFATFTELLTREK